MTDWSDPNTWVFPEHEFRIYGDDRAQTWAVVDEDDYHWLIAWRWAPKVSRGGKKVYLYRTITDRVSGNWSLFLHVAIMERSGVKQPSPQHVVVDHRNGDSLDCRKANLRWATRSMNRLNVNGARAHDLVDG